MSMHLGGLLKVADWDFYRAIINDKIASVYLNLEASDELNSNHTTLFWFFIKLKIERDDGLSHDDEVDELYEYEDNLIDALCDDNMRFVGRITSSGMRQFYFYGAENIDFEGLKFCKLEL